MLGTDVRIPGYYLYFGPPCSGVSHRVPPAVVATSVHIIIFINATILLCYVNRPVPPWPPWVPLPWA